MPVCIAGMGRSGTSMCARLLHVCGLYLGQDRDLLPPAPDNPDGFWENLKFLEFNDQLLNELGGAWDSPPLAVERWHEAERLARFRAKAGILLQEFSGHDPWGWKD